LSNGVTNALPTGTVLTLGSSSDGLITNTYNLNGYNQTVAALENGSSVEGNAVVTNNAASGLATLTLSGTNSDGTSTSSTYGGTIQDGTTAQTALAITGGAHTLARSYGIEEGIYTYSGGTTISNGTLVVNAGGQSEFGANGPYTTSGTGSGNVAVNSGGVLTGSGTIAPATGNSITVASGGVITPGGASGTMAQGWLGINGAAAGSLVLTLQTPSGATSTAAQLSFDLGSGMATTTVSGFTFAGTSTYINLFGPLFPMAGLVQFNNNLVQLNDLTNGNLAPGDYLLFLGVNASYSGLTVAANGEILSGLSLTGSTAEFYGGSELFLQNGVIYADVVPEPSPWAPLLGGLGVLTFFNRRWTLNS
jgi:hypothetical protein